MAKVKAENNIVMFPFMAYGHINPFMGLAKQLERRKGCAITIVNTPLNIQKLKSSLPSDTTIRLVEIPFNGVEYGLPPGVENTDNLSCELMIQFLIASQNLKSSFKNIVIGITKNDGSVAPACIVCDMFLGWTVEVANELGIFHSVFLAGAGYSFAVYFSISLNNMRKCKAEEDREFFILQDFPEVSAIESSQLGFDLKLTDATEAWWIFRERQFSFCLRSDAVLLNTIDELGDIGVKYFSRKLGGKPVWMIGPACSSVKKDGCRKIDGLFAWLDLHPPASVLFVCFGSQNTILPAQMKELALGLEASGKTFIWVVRPPIGCSATEELEAEWFPEGFEESIRRKNQGILVPKWAPQLEILSHKSTGAFLSHCGWNSVLESLCRGVPMIGWPLAGEQFFNSKMLEEAGLCIEIARGNEAANMKHDHATEVIKTVMGMTKKGEEMRRKAGEFKEKLQEAITESEGFKGSSIKAMDEFLNAAISKSSKANPSFL